ncbi:MAG: ACT domain-containing protein [bacterium]|nr:ACT domain-containing protein [bacterium]
MKTIKQISVFSENRPGKLEKVTKVLADNGINIRAITIASSEKFGVIKFLVDRTQAALDLLKQQGFTVAQNEIMAIEISDEPGGLHRLADLLARKKVNIENASGFVIEASKKAVILVEAADIEQAKSELQNEGLRFLSEEEIIQ